MGLLDWIPVVGSLVSGAYNAISTANNNQANRTFAVQMYDRQRADAVSDRDYQNAYNTPAAQMGRLKAAGLNPNLVYGSGAQAAPAVQTRGADGGTPHTEAPQIPDLGGVWQGFLRVQQLQAQTDNLRAQKDLIAAEIANKGASTESTEWQTERSKALMPVLLEQQQATLEKTVASTGVMLDANERAAALQASNLQAAAENVLNLRASRAKTDAETNNARATLATIRNTDVLQKLDIKLKQMGIQPGDPMWSRVLGQILGSDDPGKKAGAILQKAIEALPGIDKGDANFLNATPGSWGKH